MSLHKLTAGDGYTYLTRQVATADSTELGYSSLGDYYAAKGESAGVWSGAQATEMGLAGTTVTEQQMKNLFGLGIHPDADRLQDKAEADGLGPIAAASLGRLGAKFPVFQASPMWHEMLAAAYQRYNLDAGLAKGDKVPETAKQAIRTQVGTAMFTAEYGREPLHEHELSGFIAQQSRPVSSAVAGYDLTFSPVKSVSTLWSIAPREVAEQLEAAHDAAVRGTLLWLEKEAGYTRECTGSVAQIRTKGFMATAFTHRDSRAGDPDLHTHVAVSNKVQTPDGRWLSLDARMLYRYNVAASEQYNLLLEKEVVERVGGRFAERGDAADGKREIRELVGVPAELNEHFSSRRVMIQAHRAQLVAKFVADHGRVPTAIERIQLAQQATLATRQAKHEPTSLAEQRALWQSYPADVCAESPTQILSDVLGESVEYADVTPDLVADLIERTVQVVAESRAQWRDNNLSAEARRQVKAAGIHPDQMPDLAEQVTTAAAGSDYSIPIGMDTEIAQPIPKALLDVDGKAVFRVAKGQLYTSPQILDAESRIVAAAGQADAWALSDTDVDLAHLEWSANNQGRTLNTGQEAMVRQVATSGRRLQLVFGPAGTGKTTSLAVLSLAAQSRGITVLGLTPQASAAQELAAAIPGITSDTLHKLVWHLKPEDPGAARADLPADPVFAAAAAQLAENLAWISDIGPNHLVIIDEAGLAGTRELDLAISHITNLGGRVLLVGDDRQRAANGAGGVLRDIESSHGALQLDEVMRFQDHGAHGSGALHGRVTLALRQGDPGSVGYYADRGLIRAVTPDTAADEVFAGWSADIAGGADSIMIAPTLDMVSDLNGRARAARLAATAGPTGPEVALARGERVSAGDLIVTKKNKRVLSLGGTDFVRNNYRWRVDQVNQDGSITATELTRGVTRTLPAWYVDKGWVRLGYAHTEASVQGMTVGGPDKVGTAHAVFTDKTNRNQLYTNLSRATDRTVSYGILPGTGDSHEVTTPTAVNPETVIEMFTAAVGRDGSDRSATTTLRESADPAFGLGAPGNAALAYTHAITKGSIDLVGPERMKLIAETVEVLVPGLTTSPAWETLRGHLASIEAAGGNPVIRLDRAARGRELTTADDLAAVLDYRLDPTGNHSLGAGPLPYLPAIPAALAAQPIWDTYLPARGDLVAELAQQVRDRAFGWTLGEAPAWAIPYLQDMDLVADLAVWRAAHAVPDTDLRPAGPRPLRLADRTWHTQFVDRAVQVAGDPAHGTDRWKQVLTEQHHLNVAEDDWFPVLAARLTLAEAAGIDVPALLAEAIGGHAALPAQVPAKALWWRLEPRLGSLTADHALPPSGHRLRPAWITELTEAVGELDAERVMSDRLWPTIVAHVDRAIREGQSATLILPAAAGMFVAARPTVGTHEMATVLLWQISTVTDPAPPDPELESAYPDPEMDDLLVPAGAHDLLDVAATEPVRPPTTTTSAPPVDPSIPDADPFDVDRYAAAAAVIDAVYAGVDLAALAEPEDHELAGERLTEELPPVDLATALPDPVREWVSPEPPSVPVAVLEPDLAPVIMRTAEQEAALARARAAITAAQEFWAEQTPGSWVPAYIAGRGLDPAEFLYAPAGWTRTSNHLQRQGFTEAELKAAGLITMSVRGSYVDLFQDRAVTAIHDPDTGDVVAFSGRKNPDSTNERAPKYVNSPTTELFHKSELPFGLTSANIAALRAGADLAVVEGPMDALAVNHAFDGDRAVVALAASGVAFTADHIHAINRIAPHPDRRWLLVLDDDAAGQAAAVRIFPRLAAAGVSHPETVAGLAGKDPAEILQTQGTQALRDAFDARRPLADLVIDTLIAETDLSNGWVESRWRAMSDVAPFIAALPRDQIIDQTLRAAEIIGWDTNNAIDMVARHIPDTPTPPAPVRPATPGDLGLPERPRLSTAPRPEPTGRSSDRGTVLTRAEPDTDSAIDTAPDHELDPVDVDAEPASAADVDPMLAEVVESNQITQDVAEDVDELADIDVAAGPTVAVALDHDEAIAGAAGVDVEPVTDVAVPVGQLAVTEEQAALAWLEAVDPDAHAEYLQVQADATDQRKIDAAEQMVHRYRTDTATETTLTMAAVSSATAADSVADAAAELTERPFEELPEQILAEEAKQLEAAAAAAQLRAAAAGARHAELVQEVAGDHGPEMVLLRAQVEANRERLRAIAAAEKVVRQADAAEAATAALALQLLEAEQELIEVRGAFAGRRRAELQERIADLTVAHQQQENKMVELEQRSQELAAQTGTPRQQQQALAAREPGYREKVVSLVAHARAEDTAAVGHAKDWVATQQMRSEQAQQRLAQVRAEQAHRWAHPDPAAEQRRLEIYNEQQAELEEAGDDFISSWERDLDGPAAADQGFER